MANEKARRYREEKERRDAELHAAQRASGFARQQEGERRCAKLSKEEIDEAWREFVAAQPIATRRQAQANDGFKSVLKGQFYFVSL